MSDVSVLYKSCVAYVDKWTSVFSEFNDLTKMFMLQTKNRKILNHMSTVVSL